MNPPSAGDLDTGKTVLRDYNHATVGSNELADAVETRLMRDARSSWNPLATNLLRILAYLIRHEDIRHELRTATARA